jgi:hypothetical protein
MEGGAERAETSPDAEAFHGLPLVRISALNPNETGAVV